MNNVVKVCLIILFLIFIIFIFYLFNIKPYITGNYIQTTKDCKKGYDCICLKETCICKFEKYSVENKISCKKNILTDKQINYN